MSNLPEETGKVAVNIIDGLKQYPALLAVIVLNITVLVIFAQQAGIRQANDHAEINKILDACYDRQAGRPGPH